MGYSPPAFMGFSRQEYRSGLPGDLPDPRIEPMSLASPALTGGFFTTEPPGKPYMWGGHFKQPVVFLKCQLYVYIHFCSLLIQSSLILREEHLDICIIFHVNGHYFYCFHKQSYNQFHIQKFYLV